MEVLAGAAENLKFDIRKALSQFKIIEFDDAAVKVAKSLAFKYRVSKNKKFDFLIAAIAIANKMPLLTENDKDFQFKEIKLLPYKISL